MVIDKDEIILKSVEKALRGDENFQYDVTTCNSAMEGLMLVRKEIFDIIIIDLILPGINGIELLKRIRKINQDIPIIILSGYSSAFTNDELIQNGKTELLLKPFTTEEINSLVIRISGLKRLAK